MLTTALGLNGSDTIHDLSELVSLVTLERNHHEYEFGPRNDSIVVLVVIREHLLGIGIRGLSMTKIDHNILELLAVHGSITVLIVVLEGLNELSLLLSTQALLVLHRKCKKFRVHRFTKLKIFILINLPRFFAK